jgi:hypothetical protein
VIVVAAVALTALAPVSVYDALQTPRDSANHYALNLLHRDNRTIFFNPYPPDSFLHFWGNYIYALGVLNVPFVRVNNISANEFVIALNVAFFVWLLMAGQREGGKSQALAMLFLSHIIVLNLFDPDLGSYFRHFSSVYLYLIPAFAWLELRRTRVVVSEQGALSYA